MDPTLGAQIPPELHRTLHVYCDVNAPELTAHLRKQIEQGEVSEEFSQAVREQLGDAIRGKYLTPGIYAELTGDTECTTGDLLEVRLREIYEEIFATPFV
jgi:hypothetical protein